MDHPNQLSLSPQLFSYKTKFYNKTFLHLGASAEFFDFIIDMVRGSVIIYQHALAFLKIYLNYSLTVKERLLRNIVY